MTEQEFINSLSTDKVLIDLDRYEDLIVTEVILSRIKSIIEKSEEKYGLSSEETKLIKILLGVEK
jgi:hypothetical protein